MEKLVQGNEEIHSASTSPYRRRDYRWGDGKFQASVVAVRKGGNLFFVQLIQQLAPQQTGTEYETEYEEVLGSIGSP